MVNYFNSRKYWKAWS